MTKSVKVVLGVLSRNKGPEYAVKTPKLRGESLGFQKG